MSTKRQEKICGVDRDIIEHFLFLVREKYPKVDEAIFYLETYISTSGINIGIVNQRDTLSHLVSVLMEPEMSRDKMLAHLNQSDEHMRNAMIESYEVAVTIMYSKVVKVVNSYKSNVLSLLPHENMPAAPDLAELGSMFRLISSLRMKGREAKRKNSWKEAEEAAMFLLTAFKKLEQIKEKLEGYIAVAAHLRESKKTRWLTIWGIIATVLAAALGILVVILSQSQ